MKDGISILVKEFHGVGLAADMMPDRRFAGVDRVRTLEAVVGLAPEAIRRSLRQQLGAVAEGCVSAATAHAFDEQARVSFWIYVSPVTVID